MEHNSISKDRQRYLRRKKYRRRMILSCQTGLVAVGLLLWELLGRYGIIDPFIMSQPSRIAATFSMMAQNGLALHLLTTLYETLTGFLLGTALGLGAAVLLWWSDTLAAISEPFLVVLNALPKIALGPVIIIWVGAGTKAIIVMALAISLVVSILEMLNGFRSTDADLIRMVRTFGAGRRQIFTKVVFPSNLPTLFHALKVNIGLSLVGVIAGEFLVSKAGLGYLIVYGGQVFKLDLVMTSVLILAIMAALMYQGVSLLERGLTGKISHCAVSKED